MANSKDTIVKVWEYVKPIGEVGVILFGLKFIIENVGQPLLAFLLS